MVLLMPVCGCLKAPSRSDQTAHEKKNIGTVVIKTGWVGTVPSGQQDTPRLAPRPRTRVISRTTATFALQQDNLDYGVQRKAVLLH
jgi:hypothetical protein